MVRVRPSPRVSLGTREGSQMLRNRSEATMVPGQSCSCYGHCHALHTPTLKSGASATPVGVTAVCAIPRGCCPQSTRALMPIKATKQGCQVPSSPCPYSSLPCVCGTGFQDQHHLAAPSPTSSGEIKPGQSRASTPSSLEVEVFPGARLMKTTSGAPRPAYAHHLIPDTEHWDLPGPSWGLLCA